MSERLPEWSGDDWSNGYEENKAYAIGSKVMFSVVPNSIQYLYEFDDNSDATTAIDSQGNIDHNINGATYTTNSAVGSYGLSYNGSGDETQSVSTVDLVSAGDTMGFSIMGWVNPDTTSGNIISWGDTAGNNHLLININGNGNWLAFLQVGTNNVQAEGTSVDTTRYTHVYAEATQTDVSLYVDGSQVATTSNSQDLGNLGTYYMWTGHRGEGISHFGGLLDDVAFAVDPLTDSEIQDMVNRST